MKEIVIISGKGGTGKTSLTASFAVLCGNEAVTADCDVDAADMHVFLQPDRAYREDFYSGRLAVIDPRRCIDCGKCADVCRFDAIRVIRGHHSVQAMDCEGCGYCARICPARAIAQVGNHVGWWYESGIRTGSDMIHARMKVGAENSGKLVAKVKKEARRVAEAKQRELILVDGSPGIGCPVVSSLSGADYVLMVTEPSVSGRHDLERLYALVEKFRLPAGCVINKADLNPGKRDEIAAFLKEKQIDHIADLPYDLAFSTAMVKGKTIVEEGEPALRMKVESAWRKIRDKVNQNHKGR